MPVRTRPWYRKHVEEYIRAHPGYRLADHLPHDIDEYLAAKGRLGSLQEWRFRQIVDALRLLFTELITTRWADAYDWAQWRAFARSLEPDHETLARAAADGRLAAPSNNAMITRFILFRGFAS